MKLEHVKSSLTQRTQYKRKHIVLGAWEIVQKERHFPYMRLTQVQEPGSIQSSLSTSKWWHLSTEPVLSTECTSLTPNENKIKTKVLHVALTNTRNWWLVLFLFVIWDSNLVPHLCKLWPLPPSKSLCFAFYLKFLMGLWRERKIDLFSNCQIQYKFSSVLNNFL